MTAHREALDEARLERLYLAASDMREARSAARFLLSTHPAGGPDDPLTFWARRALETGMFTAYARAFTTSRGTSDKRPLPRAPTKSLSAEDRRVHNWALTERRKNWAHSDRDGSRKTRPALERDGSGEFVRSRGVMETWSPPSPEQLEAFATLAEALEVRYRAEADALWDDMNARGVLPPLLPPDLENT